MINKSQAQQSNLNILDSTDKSQDDRNEIIEKLKQLLPNIINSDNQLDTRALQDVMDLANTTSNNQGYELTFAGKGIAKAKADTATDKELKVELEQSKDFYNTENVVIRGDNIDTLKILKANYTDKIKMIYIDPPYNTKNENFIYNDNFKKNEAELIKEFGLADETQNFLTNVYGTRSHSGWLSFMYPRLKIARELLKEDGVIFISIDDNEQANLKIMCDEIFGEENFVANLVWQKRYSRENRETIGDVHEHILIYSLNIDVFRGKINKLPITEEQSKVYKNTNNDPRGRWRSIPLTAQAGHATKNQFYEIKAPNGKIHIPPSGRCWGISKKTYEIYLSENRIYFGKDNNSQPNLIRYLSEVEGMTPWTWWPSNEAGHTDEAKKEIYKILDGVDAFDTPKPCRLIKRILQIATDKDSDVLDFFAGSGTTGDAVMQLNAEDGGKRKFILAQLDESIDEKKEAYKFCKDNGFEPVISSITIERLNRAGEKIKADVLAELEAEQSKKKPNIEKLAELTKKYVRVFGYTPENNGNRHENGDLLTQLKEIPSQAEYFDSGLDIGYKVFSLKDKPCIKEVVKDGGQVEFVPQNLRQSTIDTLANMLCATCKPLHTKIETLIADKLYKADNEIYLLDNISREELDKYKDFKINIDGYSDLNLEMFLNLGVADKDNVSVVY